MPNWIPGKKNGENVNVEFNLPVKFRLEEGAKKTTLNLEKLQPEPGKQPLFVVNGEIVDRAIVQKIDPASIATINVLKDEFNEFGEKGKNGVVKIQLKGDIKVAEKNKEKQLETGIKPLIVVNGEIVPHATLQKIDPKDIATINVVKDAAAIKEFGEKGENGVVKIQLKGKIQILEKTDENGVKHYRTLGDSKKDYISSDETSGGEAIYKVVDNMPLFPGCENEKKYSKAHQDCAKENLLQFIYTNIKYPKAAQQQGIEGVVVIRFLVEKDGTTSSAEILRNIGGGTGEEALRVVNLMNEQDIRWIPGQQDGQAVNVQFNLPVKFKLAKEEPAEEKKIIYHPDAPKLPIGYEGEATELELGSQTITLNVFPNPVREQLSVTLQGEAKDVLLSVFDLSGKEYYSEKIQSFGGALHKTIDVKNAPKGTLIVNIRHQGKDYQKKVVVQ